MRQVLPLVKAIFNIDEDGEVYLGFEYPGSRAGGLWRSFRRTSAFFFDSALAYALCNRQEKLCYPWLKARNGGEIGMLLESVAASNVDAQIIACTCHEIGAVPDGWDLSRIGENGEVMPEKAANAFLIR